MIEEIKIYTVKEWNRFSEQVQEKLTQQYDVILSDHETKNEKLKRYCKAINMKNFDKCMKMFDSGMKKVDEFWKQFDSGMNNGFGKNKSNPTQIMWGTKND